MKELAEELRQLKQRVGLLEDQQAVRSLQFKYGYYMDKCLFGDIVELFADDATLYFLNGIFRGKEGARRLYGGGTGLNGPVNGMLFEHIIAQDIVDVAADRTKAWGRFRCFLQGGVHQSKTDAPKHIPAQFWEAGIYENEYVREDGAWKIKRLDYMMQWQGDYESGLAHTVSHLQPAAILYPEDPLGPDVILPAAQIRQTWPHRQDVPMHFAHPRFGALLAGQEPRA